jgi:hypothetical protein
MPNSNPIFDRSFLNRIEGISRRNNLPPDHISFKITGHFTAMNALDRLVQRLEFLFWPSQLASDVVLSWLLVQHGAVPISALAARLNQSPSEVVKSCRLSPSLKLIDDVWVDPGFVINPTVLILKDVEFSQSLVAHLRLLTGDDLKFCRPIDGQSCTIIFPHPDAAFACWRALRYCPFQGMAIEAGLFVFARQSIAIERRARAPIQIVRGDSKPLAIQVVASTGAASMCS